MDADLAIIAITPSRFHDRTPAPIIEESQIPDKITESGGPPKNVNTAVQDYWIKQTAAKKNTAYKGKTKYPFEPWVLTTGGTCGPEFTALVRQFSPTDRAAISSLLLRYAAMIVDPQN